MAAEDVVGKELEEQVRANEALLQGLKYDYGQRVLQAENEGGEYPGADELATIRKLEGQLQNDRAFLQARALTRTAR